MDYSKETIDTVSTYASNLTPISEIAVLLDLDIDELRMDILDRGSDISKAYYKAKATTAFNLRSQEIDLAKVGSPLAVQLTAGYLVNMDTDEDL